MQSSNILSSIQPIENNVEPIVTQTGMIARSMLIIIPILVIVAVIIIVAVCCSKGKKNKQNEK